MWAFMLLGRQTLPAEVCCTLSNAEDAGSTFQMASSAAACDSLYTVLPQADGGHRLLPITHRGTIVQMSHSGAAPAATLTADLLADPSSAVGAGPRNAADEAQVRTCNCAPTLSQ